MSRRRSWKAAARSLSARKKRLYHCAMARHWAGFCRARYRAAVEVAELFADGQATARRLAAANRYANQLVGGSQLRRKGVPPLTAEGEMLIRNDLFLATYDTDLLESYWRMYIDTPGSPPVDDEVRFRRRVLYDLAGEAPRPGEFAPDRRTSTAVGLARTMYDTRDFAAMPILADALEDAACDDADLLAHLRGGGPHVRGCWAVDLVLGKG